MMGSLIDKIKLIEYKVSIKKFYEEQSLSKLLERKNNIEKLPKSPKMNLELEIIKELINEKENKT